MKLSLPGTILGDHFSAGGFYGKSTLDVDLGTSPAIRTPILTPAGDFENHARIYGGFATFVHEAFYLVGTAAFANGESKFVDHPNNFSRSFGTEGHMLSAHIGKVIPLEAFVGVNVNLDLRAGISLFEFEADRFLSRPPANTLLFENELETTTVVMSAQLFTVLELAGATVRPFVKGQRREDLNYKNSMLVFNAPTLAFVPRRVRFNQDNTVNNIEIGANVAFGAFNLSAAAFTEWSEDRDANGGRLAIKYRFN